jgi:hypothetical protein
MDNHQDALPFSSSLSSSSKKQKNHHITEVGNDEDNNYSDSKVNDDDNMNDVSLLKIALTMLSSMLAFGNNQRNEKEENILQSLRELLQKLAWLSTDDEMSEIARELANAVFERQLSKSEMKSIEMIPATSVNNLEEFIARIQKIHQEYLVDTSPPLRGYGINQLSILIVNNTLSKVRKL